MPVTAGTRIKYPRGWDQPRVQRVIDHYESESDEEAAAEIEAGLESTTMEVPRALVPAVRQLIAKRKAADRTKTGNAGRQPMTRARYKSRAQKNPRSARD
jgi:hypothetical protein